VLIHTILGYKIDQKVGKTNYRFILNICGPLTDVNEYKNNLNNKQISSIQTIPGD